ncbi:hypothetical protein [Marinobacter sp.]|uniref:C1q-like domain-containing protein n=1 Tax=Marinobacter sp. TaxID=50741 RepID=UPI000C98EF8F|nr:hypothetical protein [Marinobacter sp.]MAK51043.1 hypothetical protein [Marinobacter sp.]
MTSSYTVNNGLEKPAAGDQEGAWGGTLNTNFDIIDRVLSGVGSISLSGTTHTLTTTDGTLTDGMYRVLVFTGALGANNTVTISPNDQDKLYFIVNNTTDSGSSGPYSVIIKQGTGATVTVENGRADIVYADGAGSGAAVVSLGTEIGQRAFDLYTYTASAGQTTFTGSDTSSKTLAYSAGNLFVTLNGVTLENGTDYTATNGTSVVLTDAATADDELNIYAFNTFSVANVTTASADFSIGDDLSFTSDGAIINMGADSDVTLTHVADTGVTLSAGDNATVLQLDSNDSGASSGPKILLNRTSDSPADDDYTGTIIFQGENDNNQQFKTAQLSAQAKDVSDGTEDSELQLATIINGTLTNGVVVTSNGVSMPTQPAWGARGTGSVTMSGTSSYVVAANSVEVVDIGGNYDTSTYQFTAPMDGTYYVAMSFCPTTLPGVTGPAQWLYKNGSALKELGINYSSDRFETTTGVYILSLDAGDYIEQRMVNYNNTTFVLDRSRGFFGGFLIG